MMTINTPGDAMRAATALLRHHGWAVDSCEAGEAPDGNADAGFVVSGRIYPLGQVTAAGGHFRATATRAGHLAITSGLFGKITDDEGEDPFHDL